MDLNKTMVEMYKRRTSINGKTNNKRPKPEDGPVEQPSEQQPYHSNITFDQLYGCESVRDKILKEVKWFQRSIETDRKEEVTWPILICGSSGIGKTSLVEAAANHSKLELIPIFLKRLIGRTRSSYEITLQQIANRCRSRAPVILLIDDLNIISDKEEFKTILMSTIIELLENQCKLLIFCTTTSLNDILQAIEFSTTLQLKRPDLDARFKILKHLRDKSTDLENLTDEDLKLLAIKTPSFTPRDLRKMLHRVEVESEGHANMTHCDKAVQEVQSSFARGTYLVGERPLITWNDIGGLDDVRSEFNSIMKQVGQGDVNCKYAGIALYGPPGCGKTMVAQAMANEAGLNFIAIKSTELLDKFHGETEKNIRRVFMEAKEFEPCMIYFDEFDGLCGSRARRDNLTGAVNTLLSEMDGFANRGKSIILVSTNRLNDIDSAMKRPGRLSHQIYVGPPNEEARRQIFSVLTSKKSVSLAQNINLNDWAKRTENFSGAEIGFLVSKAIDLSTGVLSQENLEQAMQKVRASNPSLDKKIELFEKRPQ